MKDIIGIFCGASGMNINSHKSSFSFTCRDQLITDSITHLFSYKLEVLELGIKYLGFHLKPNAYKKGVRAWILKKLSWKVVKWTSRWLSLGGRLLLIIAVLQSIPAFWFSLFKVLTGIIDAMKKMIFRFP